MRTLRDHVGTAIRLTEERPAHILEHPEMRGLENSIAETVAMPERVIESLSDPLAHLYYRHYADTPAGAKFLCVVVMSLGSEPFVLTAYLTNRIKRGVPLWPRNG